MGLPSAFCLGVCLSAAAAATDGSETNEKGVTVAGGVHVGVILTVIVLHTSLVRSSTWVWSWALSSLYWSMTLFVWSAWMLVRVIILEVHRVSIFLGHHVIQDRQLAGDEVFDPAVFQVHEH